MTRRPLFIVPFLALFAALTTACGSPSTDAPAGPVTSTAAAAAPVPHATRKPATTTRTVTVTVTTTVHAQPVPTTTSTPTPPSFAAFAGEWSGHTKLVTVSRTGRMVEHVGDGCCHPVVDMVIQLSNPHRVGKAWVADGRVVSATVHDGWDTSQRAPKPGDRTTVKVSADHILTETITGYVFCDYDKVAPGTCGA